MEDCTNRTVLPSHRRTSLMDLPRETRLQILSYLPKPQTSLAAPSEGGPDFSLTFPRSVLLVNRQLYVEALSIFYGNNWFYLSVDQDVPFRESGSIKFLTEASYRPLVRNFYLYITIKPVSNNPHDSISKVYLQTAARLQGVLQVLARGPPIKTLGILLWDQCAYQCIEWAPRQPVVDAFSPLYGRVRKVDILLWETVDDCTRPQASLLKSNLENKDGAGLGIDVDGKLGRVSPDT